MDFSMIRPKPPTMKPEPPQPEEEPPSSDPPPAAPKEPPPPPPSSPPPPPPPHQKMAYSYGYGPHSMGPYMEEFYRSSHKHRLRSIEYTNARTWRANFGGHSDDHYYDNPYKHGTSGHQQSKYMVEPPHSHDYMLPQPSSRLGLPPPDHHHHHPLPGPPPRLGLPPKDHHHALPGPPSRLGLPPPDHHHALPGPESRLDLPPPDHHLALPGPPPRFSLPPPDYHHGPPPPPPLSPYRHSQPYYDYFSDENPNGCVVM